MVERLGEARATLADGGVAVRQRTRIRRPAPETVIHRPFAAWCVNGQSKVLVGAIVRQVA